ncbi:hypothetical protein CBM2637_A10018 [Cupriavidus taiwanensis]|nr:hypothetical protein CBM2637_A10018 [Cupriavidus taiwanensis]SPA47424.1 protein of unknown function [Cupriavidus taiwanensis]
MSDKAHREQIVTWQFPQGRASTGLEANRTRWKGARRRRDSGANGKCAANPVRHGTWLPRPV